MKRLSSGRNKENAMLPESVNNSISDRKTHLSREAVKALFFKTDLNAIERYAADVVFTEASLQEIVDFLKANDIPFQNAARLYAAHKRGKTTTTPDKYDWFFGSFPELNPSGTELSEAGWRPCNIAP